MYTWVSNIIVSLPWHNALPRKRHLVQLNAIEHHSTHLSTTKHHEAPSSYSSVLVFGIFDKKTIFHCSDCHHWATMDITAERTMHRPLIAFKSSIVWNVRGKQSWIMDQSNHKMTLHCRRTKTQWITLHSSPNFYYGICLYWNYCLRSLILEEP